MRNHSADIILFDFQRCDGSELRSNARTNRTGESNACS